MNTMREQLSVITGSKVLHNIMLYFIAGVLLVSGIAKIIDPMPMIETLKALTHLGEDIIILGATLLPVIEIALGILLILRIRAKMVIISTIILFASFLLLSIYGTIEGISNDCGCFGSLVKSQIGWGMVLRNSAFVLLTQHLLQRNIIK